MFTNDELTIIAGQLRSNANETLRRCPEHTFAETLLEIAAKAESEIAANTPIERPDDLADYVSFIDSRNLRHENVTEWVRGTVNKQGDVVFLGLYKHEIRSIEE